MTATAQIRDPLVGTRIDGRYFIRGVLGRGGMGVVYDGVHEQLGRPVAIKVLSSGIATEPSAIERFLREARTASSLTHGNIVDVTDLGSLPDGRPYLVMPKMNGQDLLSLLRAQGPQSPMRVVELLRGAAAALDVIHAKGFVHRDVKPENLMHVVHDDGSERVLLLDFGIVALTSKQDQRLTADGVVFGTPIYLAPEIMEHDEPDARTDVYSLAVVAFELMTGRAPFEANTSIRIMQLKSTADAPTMQATSGLRFPKDIEEVIARGLARNPKKRFAAAGEFVRALEAAARGSAGPDLSLSPDLDMRGKELSSRIAALPTLDAVGEAGVKTDVHPTLRERLARRKGMVLAACIGPLLGAAIAWGLPDANRTPAAPPLPAVPAPPRPAPQPSVEALPTPEPVVQQTVFDLPPPVSPDPSAGKAGRGGRKDARTKPSASAPTPDPTPAASEPPSATSSGEGSTLVKSAAQALVMGKLDLADRLYAEATQKEPRNASAWRGLGLTSERLGRRETAIQAFQRSIELAPSGPQSDSIRVRLKKLTGAP